MDAKAIKKDKEKRRASVVPESEIKVQAPAMGKWEIPKGLDLMALLTEFERESKFVMGTTVVPLPEGNGCCVIL